jgi:hypothetical protein
MMYGFSFLIDKILSSMLNLIGKKRDACLETDLWAGDICL